MFSNSSDSSSILEESNDSSFSSTTSSSIHQKSNVPKFGGFNSAPPMRSINDEMISLRRSFAIKDRGHASQDILPPPTEEEKDFWVTVFGFDEIKDIKAIIELFRRHGEIVKTCRPAAGKVGNWIHLRFTTKVHAQQALQRHGEFMDNHFIGVIQSPNIPYGSYNPNEYCYEDISMLDETLPAENGNDLNLNVSHPTKPNVSKPVRSIAVKMPVSASKNSFMRRFFG